ncbi:MAG: formate dehydrogenase accessory sulfurtransferase FdhD [Caulobacteraceae bacterium]|nr:formate dehydrogenase accessory sulfurtransferase FdhD [Caulobacteraceae bacterium]
MLTLPPAVETRAGLQWRRAAAPDLVLERPLAEEAAVGILYDGRPHAVLMATPEDVEDLAIGFTLSERIASAEQIAGVGLAVLEAGVQVDIRLTPAGARSRARSRVRSMEGRSSCGLCGVERLSAAVRPLGAVAASRPVSRTSIERALDALDEAQTLGRLTRAMHAAAFAGPEGELLIVREDVGRHNALDKLIGAVSRAGLDPGEGFCLITSRCSYEMVDKAAVAGFPVLVAISAPTALAIRKAQEANIALIALARADGAVLFTGGERIAP